VARRSRLALKPKKTKAPEDEEELQDEEELEGEDEDLDDPEERDENAEPQEALSEVFCEYLQNFTSLVLSLVKSVVSCVPPIKAAFSLQFFLFWLTFPHIKHFFVIKMSLL